MSKQAAKSSPRTIARSLAATHATDSSATIAQEIHSEDLSGLTHSLPKRRSSFAERLGSFGEVGGFNSLNNFARSWQRAASFNKIDSYRSRISATEDLERQDGLHAIRQGSGQANQTEPSLPRSNFEDGEAIDRPSDAASGKDSSRICVESSTKGSSARQTLSGQRIPSSSYGILQPTNQQIDSPIKDISRSCYGSIASTIRVHDESPVQSSFISTQPPRQEEQLNDFAGSWASEDDGEDEPLLTEPARCRSKEAVSSPGESTFSQSIFNSANVLIGVGMLALPIAMRYSGWLFGILFFIFAVFSTSYTAKLLAKCLQLDDTLVTFADLAYIALGARARILISLLFTLELFACCVALVILFADSIDALLPTLGISVLKVFFGLIMIPLSFFPLRLLSFTSILGIISCCGILVAVLFDGIWKPRAIGSLLDPAPTFVLPQDWRTLPLAFGLLMAPWGGHGVFPNIYRDMRFPRTYNKVVNITYVFTAVLELSLAIIGYLMFGEETRDEITSNILLAEGYPRWLSIFIVIAIAVIPVTKFPLSARPIISTMEIFCSLHPHSVSNSPQPCRGGNSARALMRFLIRIFITITVVIVAILVPSFDRVMSLLGSLACFTICIVLPCSFHLRLFGKDLTRKQWLLDYLLVVTGIVLGTAGTVCSILPRRFLGVRN